MRFLVFFLFYCGTFLPSYGQQDILERLKSKELDDSTRQALLIELSGSLRKNEPIRAIEYAYEALTYGVDEDALNHLAIAYYTLGAYDSTLRIYTRLIDVTQDEIVRARIYNNMGVIYDEVENYERAIFSYQASMKLKRKNSVEDGLSVSLGNLGYIYYKMDSLDLATDYFKEALHLDSLNKDNQGLYVGLCNLALVLSKRDELDSAINYFKTSLDLVSKYGDKFGEAEILLEYGIALNKRGEYNNAMGMIKKSIALSHSFGAKSLLSRGYEGLSKVQKNLGQYQNALNNYILYTTYKDSLFNEVNADRFMSIEKSFEIQKRESEIALLKKEVEIQNLRFVSKNYTNYFLIVVVFLGAGLVFLIYQKSRLRARTNHILVEQNQEITTKNRDIIDSIQYAKSIQESILQENTAIEKYFNEAFVFCRARDIVNGDFYWIAEKEGAIVLAAVDCTGHGVPGAFMNVLGNVLLNQIINEKGTVQPSEILMELNQRVLNSLSNSNMANVNDGMDVALCTYIPKYGKLIFAGAKRPLYVIKRGNLEVIKGSLFPVGGLLHAPKRSYGDHVISLDHGDSFFLFSDGVIDQFGGTDDKKLLPKRFKEFLLEVNHLKLAEQHDALEELMNNWIGQREQTDDMLVVGVRV